MTLSNKKVSSILIGGKAGEGVKKAAQVIAKVLLKQSYHVFQADDYQSLIKGGHNFSTISFATEPVYNAYNSADLLISFDKRSMETHWLDFSSSKSLHYYNDNDAKPDITNPPCTLIGYPLTALMKQIYSSPSNVSMAAIALFFVWMECSEAELESTIKQEFRYGIEDNIRFAKAVYRMALADAHLISESKPGLQANQAQANWRLTSGNQAIAMGAWLAGLDFYYGYPMTPASSILHYLALKMPSHKVYAIHAESELAVANMAIGSVVAGAKTAIGSSGGGFALMQEAFSLAGMAEIPLLCILVSRPGPATGVSTYTAQEDLPFALNQGHGDFTRIVAAPDSPERAFSLAAELLSLAWEFQNPVILLSDKHLSESSINAVFPLDVPFFQQTIPQQNKPYERYAVTDEGISPLLFPGSDFVDEDTVIKWNSHEHLPSGLRTDKAEPMIGMKDKRARKGSALNEATKHYQRIAIYGNSGTPVFAYGSSVLELREAQKYCSKPFVIIALVYLLPFPSEELEQYANSQIVVLEHSVNGNLATYLLQNMSLCIKHNILRYDGRAYDPHELAALLEEVL